MKALKKLIQTLMELFGNHLILSCNIVIMSRDGFDPNEMSAWFHVAKAYQH